MAFSMIHLFLRRWVRLGLLRRWAGLLIVTMATALFCSPARADLVWTPDGGWKVEGGVLDHALNNVNDLTDRARHLVTTLDATVVQSQDDVSRTFSYLLETIENLNDFSRLLKEDPRVLIRGASLGEKGDKR